MSTLETLRLTSRFGEFTNLSSPSLQGGAYSRYQLMWVLLLSFAIGFVFQYLSIKIGLLTEKHLAQVCK
jgi:Mn2+/Fe2+ NRAMP family transporter